MKIRNLSLISIILLHLNVFASQKQIENFKTLTQFYTSAFPSGNINLSVDNVIFTEGNSSLVCSYNLAAQPGSFVEIFRSYASNTQDFSFQPQSFEFQIKGQANQNGNIKFMLYEDNNMNGSPFDSDDEIWSFNAGSILNVNAWQSVNCNVNQFVRIAGTGDNKLTFNRINAWRIVIENNNSNAQTGKIWIDNLNFNSNYQSSQISNANISGSFIQIWNSDGCKCGQWSQNEWEIQMQKMKEVCMDKLVIQYGFYHDNAWYSPSSATFKTYQNNTLNNILSAANNKNIDIYIGLYFDETWNTADKSINATYANLLTKHQTVIDETYQLFKSNPYFKGWYIPQEINDLEWKSVNNRNLLANWLQSISIYAKAKDANKKIMIAPYFGPNQPADVLETWYNQLLLIAKDIDIVAPQDGVGTTTKDIDTDIPLYFNAIKNACNTNQVEFWATIESFQQTTGWPIDNGSFTAIPADINRIKKQVNEVSQFSNSLLQFEWGYLQPNLNVATTKLYNDYLALQNCSVTSLANDYIDIRMPEISQNGNMIHISTQDDFVMEIFNIQGKKMEEIKLEKNLYNQILNNYNSGIYILRLNNNVKSYTYKVLVN